MSASPTIWNILGSSIRIDIFLKINFPSRMWNNKWTISKIIVEFSKNFFIYIHIPGVPLIQESPISRNNKEILKKLLYGVRIDINFSFSNRTEVKLRNLWKIQALRLLRITDETQKGRKPSKWKYKLTHG